MNPEETTPIIPDEQVKLPEEKKKLPFRRMIVFVIGAIAFVLAVAGLVLVSQLARESEDGVVEETEETFLDDAEEDDAEVSDTTEESEVVVEEEGPLMVYINGAELRLLDNDGSSTLIDTLVSPYASDPSPLIYSSYPKWSPDGLKVLYSNGLELKVYDLDTDTSSVIYTGHEQGLDGGVWYQVITRYCWKDDDSALFVSDIYTPGVGVLIDTHSVKELDVDTLVVSDWGDYEMQTGFGGATSDPSIIMRWHFSDLLSLSHEIYYSDNVYVQTYIGDARTWVAIPEVAAYSAVADSVVEEIKGTEDFEVTITETGTYESDASLSAYILTMMGSAPAYFQYSHTDVVYGVTPLLSVVSQGLWDLQVDEDEEYLFYTEIENSTDLATALDASSSAMVVNSSYPQSFIKKVDLDTEVVELVVEGLDFDLR